MKPFEKYPNECEQMIEACRRLHDRNMLAAGDGNISLRVQDGILITPSGRPKAFIEPHEIALITLDNQILYGDPTGERLMLLHVYKSCEKAISVVHAHPPHAIAWSVAYPDMRELPNNCLSEVVLAAGRIPIAPYARPGTGQMGAVLDLCLPDYRLIVLSRHGGLSWGESLEEAYMGMERLEHSAEILYKAKTLNGLSFLEEEEMQALRKIRIQLGDKTR